MKTIIASLAFLVLSNVAHAAETAAPAKADMQKVATCVDGKEYYNTTGKHGGACRGHGGVASWADGSAVHSKAGRTTEYR